MILGKKIKVNKVSARGERLGGGSGVRQIKGCRGGAE